MTYFLHFFLTIPGILMTRNTLSCSRSQLLEEFIQGVPEKSILLKSKRAWWPLSKLHIKAVGGTTKSTTYIWIGCKPWPSQRCRLNICSFIGWIDKHWDGSAVYLGLLPANPGNWLNFILPPQALIKIWSDSEYQMFLIQLRQRTQRCLWKLGQRPVKDLQRTTWREHENLQNLLVRYDLYYIYENMKTH